MIYTCYEMIRDCRQGKADGWIYFISNYLPVVRRLHSHYGGEAPSGSVEGLFPDCEPGPERRFVTELRQKILAGIQVETPEVTVDLETVAESLAPLTTVEKQAAWMESMKYDSAKTGAILRMAPATVGNIRDKAAEMLRGKTDTWRRTLLVDNGLMLGRAAAEAGGAECVNGKLFLDVLDGRATWAGREQIERHVNGCWHCIDHFCRLAETIELLRDNRPLSPAETKAAMAAFQNGRASA